MTHRRVTLLVGAGAAVAAAGVAVLSLGLSGSSHTTSPTDPDTTWPSGARPAPGFTLRDQNGLTVSTAALRGTDALLTFLDPLCRNYCPYEAKVLAKSAASLPAGKRPAIVAVSVNRSGDARANLLEDDQKWRVGQDWRWAIGSPSALASVWRRYDIGVEDMPRTIAGVTVHEITHTEASYLIDRSGHERALFVWPFTARAVEHAVASLAGA
jgi:cytochrome oxidase Cu insertion factor (SCO1/SenC/PrrC family)